jgi:hypothetical protein
VGTFTPVPFTATATAGPAANLASSGAGGTYPIGSTVTDLRVTVTDSYGNPVPGDAVSWVVTGGGGSITGDPVTDAAGSATAAWTIGSVPGLNTATASVAGLQPATFTATGECLAGFGTAQVDGSWNATEWACAASFDFEANISGGSTPATVFWQNDGTNLYMAVRVLQSSLDKVNTLRIDFDNDGDGVTENRDDVVGIDDETGFYDRFLPQRCVNRSQAGCGDDDATADGAGSVGNDGTYTVFELVHPLNSGENTDLAVSAGDTFGFFLTLQSGNGAQGNTQVPGFRVYRNVTVAGF